MRPQTPGSGILYPNSLSVGARAEALVGEHCTEAMGARKFLTTHLVYTA